MHLAIRTFLAAGAIGAASALPAAAQTAPIMTELMTAAGTAGDKLIALAKAMPADKYDWRPGAGVRSVGEVFKHVTSDNYLLPVMLGVPADASTGITADYKTASAFEARKMTKDETVAALEKSFAHLKQAMAATTADKLGAKVSMFGRQTSTEQLWIGTTTHLHEHLGQAIAYARTNGVVPPWSQKQ